jgi:hypothetical protein
MPESVSILLGAGFSAPIGYPTGDQLNKLLVNCTGDEFSFHTSGTLVISTDGKKSNFQKNSYDREFDFCKDMIKYFNESRGYFDYEEFYDFINGDAKADKKVEQLAQPYVQNTKTAKDLLYSLDNIYTHVISYYLKDGEGNRYYDNAAHMGGAIFSGYTGTLNCLKKLAEQNIINVHTLNHDLFFERLNYSDWLHGQLCDGFEELGSPYYGELSVEGRIYHPRLERYTGKYDKQFRLYKLHGSRDYGVYYSSKNSIASPEKYLKTRYGISVGELYKEITDEEGKLIYEHCWINYHADFLKGTTSKIERYKEPLLYKTLFELFKQNLKDAKMLLIIGYGGKDSEINKMILSNFDYKIKPCYIVDLYAGDKINALAKSLNTAIIRKNPENIQLADIGITT